MIFIQIPSTYEAERRYILSVMFGEFLGLDIQIQLSDRQDTRISINDDSRTLVVADGLFSTPPNQWLKSASLPKQPLPMWDISKVGLSTTTVSPEIPVIYGNEPNNLDFFQYSGNKINLGLDIFGSAFFMLTRYEEVVKSERDKHDRFPATASLAYQENFLHRPIINEYLEILWACLKYLWPRLKRKSRNFQIHLTHDVDSSFRFAFTGILSLARQCAGDLLKRRQPTLMLNNISNWLVVKKGNLEADPHNTFDYIMDISEQNNIKSAFYFITDHPAGKIDGIYDIRHPLIKELLQKIHRREHEIGLHTSYNTYQNSKQTKNEFQILREVCESQSIEQNIWGGRQHFLRWETPTTFQNWEHAGLDYDTTLSYADIAGFRCGTCYEYPTFNLITRQALKLRERPLIIMECTVLDKRYMNLSDDLAFNAMVEYKRNCQLFNGKLVILWHNTRFLEPSEVSLYQNLLSF
ncbi:hypothetical protein FEK30_06145 [Picosynechococcus sp. PCC 11901]|uniref:polysaccharide deacetylase family protein n=1 Tax=Picosynechococcus sp. PCC 11901 TaxID=2579791 RepID=UPI0010FBF263|nr:polysaccharide deacetylase family protein [Picosynechococcus sp. PCC 11901]QCS49048.1 hypothetical protein FEK30_06145 [Picosynechococcus sp. PCC 11901]